MSKFNRPTEITTNEDGFPAYTMMGISKLVTQVLTVNLVNEPKGKPYIRRTIYAIDLQDYGIQQFPGPKTNTIVGYTWE